MTNATRDTSGWARAGYLLAPVGAAGYLVLCGLAAIIVLPAAAADWVNRKLPGGAR